MQGREGGGRGTEGRLWPIYVATMEAVFGKRPLTWCMHGVWWSRVLYVNGWSHQAMSDGELEVAVSSFFNPQEAACSASSSRSATEFLDSLRPVSDGGYKVLSVARNPAMSVRKMSG